MSLQHDRADTELVAELGGADNVSDNETGCNTMLNQELLHNNTGESGGRKMQE